MARYYVVDARYSLAKDMDEHYPVSGKRQAHPCDPYLPSTKAPRTRSGSISSFHTCAASPVNRLAQTLGPERPKPSVDTAWNRHTTATMAGQSSRHGDYFFTESWNLPYAAKSNRRSVWERFTENVDRCVFRVVGKFYK